MLKCSAKKDSFTQHSADMYWASTTRQALLQSSAQGASGVTVPPWKLSNNLSFWDDSGSLTSLDSNSMSIAEGIKIYIMAM